MSAKNRLDVLLSTHPARKRYSFWLPISTLQQLERVQDALRDAGHGGKVRVGDVAAHALEIGCDALLEELKRRR